MKRTSVSVLSVLVMSLALPASAEITVRKLQRLDSLVSANDCEGLFSFLRRNKELTRGNDPLAVELAQFLKDGEQGALNCLRINRGGSTANMVQSVSAAAAASRLAPSLSTQNAQPVTTTVPSGSGAISVTVVTSPASAPAASSTPAPAAPETPTSGTTGGTTGSTTTGSGSATTGGTASGTGGGAAAGDTGGGAAGGDTGGGAAGGDTGGGAAGGDTGGGAAGGDAGGGAAGGDTGGGATP